MLDDDVGPTLLSGNVGPPCSPGNVGPTLLSGDSSAELNEQEKDGRKKKLRRRAGCLWGCVTEPIVLVGVTLLAVVFGRAYLVRRAQRLREEQQAREEDKPDERT